jgi:HlyD family secretion protein
MKRLWILVVVLALVAFLAVVGRATYQRIEAHRVATQEAAREGEGRARVVIGPVTEGTMRWTIPITGELHPLSKVTVVPKVTGELEQLRTPDGALIDVGTAVSKGDLIAVLEHSALDASVEQARAALAVANAGLVQARTVRGNAERERGRLEELYDRGSIAPDEWDQTQTAYEQAVAGVSLAQAQVEQANAALRQTQVMLEDAAIEAPIAGVVSAKFVDEGDLASPATPLLEIVDVDTVKLYGGIAERMTPQIRPKETLVEARVDAYPDEVFSGYIHNVAVKVAPQTRTVELETRLPNPGHRLKPGMFARLTVVVDEQKEVALVPAAAVIRQGTATGLYVINSGVASYRTVELGRSQGDMQEVLEGVAVGEHVVVRGQHLVQDGAEVEIVEEVQG